MNRPVTYILCLLMIAAVSCSDSDTDPAGPGDNESIEAEASIANPSEGATLSGEESIVLEGEAEEGFDEIRVLIGEEAIETIESPELPFQMNLETYQYDNGEYTLAAEFDISGEDSTISERLSVNFENYLLTLDTDGYFDYLREYYISSYVFISNPQGEVLRAVDVTEQSDGMLQLLPPEAIEGEVPKHVSLTIGNEDIYEFRGGTEEEFFLTTNLGLQPWSTFSIQETVPESASDAHKGLTVEITNVGDIGSNYFNFHFDVGGVFTPYSDIEDNTYSHDMSYYAESDNLITTYFPDPGSGNAAKFYWEENLSELSDPDKLSYDYEEDFSEMAYHEIDLPSNMELDFYSYDMSVNPDSWESGYFYFVDFSVLNYATEPSTLGMYVPDHTNHQFDTRMWVHDPSVDRISYWNNIRGELPESFLVLDANFEVIDATMDHFEIEMSGDMDYAEIVAQNYESGSHYHRWTVSVPDTITSVVYPNIVDSLDNNKVEYYNRGNFSFISADLLKYEEIDDYADYLQKRYTSDINSWGDEIVKSYAINTNEAKRNAKLKARRQLMNKKNSINFNKVHPVIIRQNEASQGTQLWNRK